ncbi:hypothetical protein D3C78_1732370 [compost metagenome]
MHIKFEAVGYTSNYVLQYKTAVATKTNFKQLLICNAPSFSFGSVKVNVTSCDDNALF